MPSRTTDKIQAQPAELSDDGQASGAHAVPDEGRVRQVRTVTESRARRRRARQAGGIVVNVMVQIHLWAIVAAPLALLDAMLRGAPEGQERWGGPVPITTIIVLAVLAVGAGVLSVLMR